MTNSKVIAGVDLGGTSMKLLVLDESDRTLAELKAPTHPGRKPARVVAEIAAAVDHALSTAGVKRSQLGAVSIGAPGAIDREKGIVHAAPNLGWREFPLGRELKSRLRAPVLVDNDVNVGLVGEHVLGAGVGANNLVGIFVGTGIGGGLILDGKLYEGARGGAGEAGHMVLMADGPACGCGQRGCAEALASRTAMERDVRSAIRAGRRSLVPEIMKRKGKDRMTSSVIAAALKSGDPVMREVLERAQSYLGILVSNLANLLDPERVVIGGGLATRMGEDFVGPIRRTTYEHMLRSDGAKALKIVPGQLGDNAGALGAVVLARRRMPKLHRKG